MQRSISGIAQRVRYMQLAELEQHSLLRKTILAQLPLRIEYHLTSLGYSILPVIAVLEHYPPGSSDAGDCFSCQAGSGNTLAHNG